MTHYTIHEPLPPPSGLAARADATRMVKEGMAWWALVLPLLWLLYHRMWLVLTGFVVALVLMEMALVLAGLSEALGFWAWILFSAVFAMHANDLRRWTLARRGYAMAGAVSGQGRDDCELKYFSTWPETRAAATPPSAAMAAPNFPAVRRQTEDRDAVIGLFPDGR